MSQVMKVAIVDDEADIRDSICQWLSLSGFDAISFASASEALVEIGPDFAGIVISDIKMPGMGGMTFLRRLMRLDRSLPVIMITGHGDVPLAVEAMRIGAYDFLEKPFNPDRMSELAQRATHIRRVTLESRALRRELAQSDQLVKRLAGSCPEMLHLREDILDLGQADNHVLIDGESGTGKTLTAHALHAVSPRASKRFITVSCAAWSEPQLEAKIFGGPEESALPLIEEASGGTLCLEDIEALSPALQARLLDVMSAQEGSPSKTRIIAICNSHSPDKTLAESLHSDLYYGFSGMTLICPPLRKRGNDIVILFQQMCATFAEEYGCEEPVLTPEGAAQLLAAPWPGNVRQLTTTAERAVLQSRRKSGDISNLLMTQDAGDAAALTTDGKPLKEHVESFERMLIDNTMRRHKGNITAVMEELSLPRRTLNEKMTKYHLQRQDYL